MPEKGVESGRVEQYQVSRWEFAALKRSVPSADALEMRQPKCSSWDLSIVLKLGDESVCGLLVIVEVIFYVESRPATFERLRMKRCLV
jgi:hypothetical protein